jgi:hypothetical protein
VTTPIRPCPPGTVSAGTVKIRDLLARLADALEAAVADQTSDWRDVNADFVDSQKALIADARGILDVLDEEPVSPGYDEDAVCILAELIDQLDTYAPEGTSFGTHPDDPADLGYWPDEGLDTPFDEDV